MLKKVVILGPESTGKSTLCKQLAEHFKTLWCPEFAREYLLKHGMDYDFADLLTIAKGQLALEDEFVKTISNKQQAIETPGRKDIPDSPLHSLPDSYRVPTPHSLLFIDTNMYVMKVWCEFVFGDCHRFILDQIVERKYDLYLLCNVDLPWIKDELREYPDFEKRQQLYLIYKDLMINQPVPWCDISGNYEERLQKAIIAIDNILT